MARFTICFAGVLKRCNLLAHGVPFVGTISVAKPLPSPAGLQPPSDQSLVSWISPVLIQHSLVSFPQISKSYTAPISTISPSNCKRLLISHLNTESRSTSSTCHLIIPPPIYPCRKQAAIILPSHIQYCIFIPIMSTQTPKPHASPNHLSSIQNVCRKGNPFFNTNSITTITPPHTPPRATISHTPTPILPRRSRSQTHNPTFLVRT